MLNKSSACRFLIGLCVAIVYAEARAQRAQLVSAMVNGCGPKVLSLEVDGLGEYLLVYSGSTSFTAGASTIDIEYANTSSTGDLFGVTDSFTSAGLVSLVSSLNSLLTGCDFSFQTVSPGSTVIPAGSHILIMNSAVTIPFNFSGLCGQGLGDIYVMFSNDIHWSVTGVLGTFRNSPPSTRLFRSTINGTVTDFSYIDGWSTDTDGDYVSWNDGGGAGSIYSNFPGCAPTNNTALPVSLTSFKATPFGKGVLVNWETASEENNHYFSLFRSQNAKSWEEIALIPGNGNSSEQKYYEFFDDKPLEGRSYYRMRQTDFNGKSEYFEVVSVEYSAEENEVSMFPNPANEYLNLLGPVSATAITLMDSYGRNIEKQVETLKVGQLVLDIRDMKNGIYELIIKLENGQYIRKRLIKSNQP